MNRGSQNFRKRARNTGAVLTAVAGILFIGGINQAQADETVSSSDIDISATYYNGYFIENNTNETLTLTSINQPGGTKCEYYWEQVSYTCNAQGEGFGEWPPQSIGPKEKGYFDIPMYVHTGTTRDFTEVVYETGERTHIFKANVYFEWKWGVPYFQNDSSTCASAGAVSQCETNLSSGRGKTNQTVFTVNPS
jgi:hypothetical protein